MTKRKPLERRACAVCTGEFFAPSYRRTCSEVCALDLRRQLARESAARKYRKRPPAQPFDCLVCNVHVVPDKAYAQQPKFCSTACRTKDKNRRSVERFTALRSQRACHKCSKPVQVGPCRPGLVVCDDCRVDRRKRSWRKASLAKYGLNEEQFAALLNSQQGKCPICRTTDPGAKGWCVDHDHVTGDVRGLLCNKCNTGIGLLRDDSAVIAAAADYVRRSRQLRLAV